MDPDHFFEINLANIQLFANLTLNDMDELLPGRLFTTRMPRNIENPESARKFQNRAKAVKLHTVLCLTEKSEYSKYAGGDLEAFYASIGINCINRPIIDFSLPDVDTMVQDVKVRGSVIILIYKYSG